MLRMLALAALLVGQSAHALCRTERSAVNPVVSWTECSGLLR
jgi:hypothetical protein